MSQVSFGKSFKLTNGDFSFDSDGKLEWVDGADNATQGITILTKTQYLSDLLAPVYGFDYEAILSSELTEEDLIEFAELKLKACLLQDDRVDDIFNLQATIDNDRNMSIQCSIRFTDGSIISVNVGI